MHFVSEKKKARYQKSLGDLKNPTQTLTVYHNKRFKDQNPYMTVSNLKNKSKVIFTMQKEAIKHDSPAYKSNMSFAVSTA